MCAKTYMRVLRHAHICSSAPSAKKQPDESEGDATSESLGDVLDQAIEIYKNPDPKKLSNLPIFAAAAGKNDADALKNSGTAVGQSAAVPPQRRNPLQKPRMKPRVNQAAVVGQDGRAVTGEEE